MQAVFLLAMYGFFYSVIAFFVHSGALDALTLKEKQIQATHQLFADIETIVTQDFIPREMTVPNFGTDIQNYLSFRGLREKINWHYSTSLNQDPWGVEFEGFVMTERTAIAAQLDGGFVQVPVSAFVLVSAGPDRVIDPALQTALTGLTAATDLREVTRIEAPLDSDDIVRTFTTYRAQAEHWEEILYYMNSIAGNMAQLFQIQFKAFIEDLKNIYGSSYTQFLSIDGKIIYNTTNQARWTADGVTQPPPSMVLLENADDVYLLGEKQSITDNNLTLRLKAFENVGGPVDNAQCLGATADYTSHMIRLCLSNNGSPWGNSSGNLFYYIDVESVDVYE